MSTEFDTAPPLTPTSDENSPVMKPKKASGPRPGSSVPRLMRSPPKNMRMAINAAKTTKATLNTAPGAKVAVTEPTATPTIAGSVQIRTTCGITAPRFLWAM